MSVVAVINTKGGCGKSTLSTNLASWCAHRYSCAMIGDLDRQKSVRTWLNVRGPECADIQHWVIDLGKTFPAPPRTAHAVLDTPSGLDHYMLSKLLMYADAVVVPVGPSLFDMAATKELVAALARHRKVSTGRCPVALVGMRWPADGSGRWRLSALQETFPVLTVISEDAVYPQLVEAGMGLFDAQGHERDRRANEWMPLLQWLDEVWQGPVVPVARRAPSSVPVAI